MKKIVKDVVEINKKFIEIKAEHKKIYKENYKLKQEIKIFKKVHNLRTKYWLRINCNL